MNGPHELYSALLRLNYTLLRHADRRVLDLRNRFLTLYIPVVGTTALAMAELNAVFGTFSQDVAQSFFFAFNELAMTVATVTDVTALITAYGLYVATDLMVHTVQTMAALPSLELSIEGDVPGGIAVWLLVALALVTYAFVYHQYPTHEDWVATVFSIVLPLLTQSLWKSD